MPLTDLESSENPWENSSLSGQPGKSYVCFRIGS